MRVLVSEEYILVYSPIVPLWKKSFLIENLITIKYLQKRPSGALSFTFLNSGFVESKLFRVGMSRTEYNLMKEAMHNKDVLMTR